MFCVKLSMFFMLCVKLSMFYMFCYYNGTFMKDIALVCPATPYVLLRPSSPMAYVSTLDTETYIFSMPYY